MYFKIIKEMHIHEGTSLIQEHSMFFLSLFLLSFACGFLDKVIGKLSKSKHSNQKSHDKNHELLLITQVKFHSSQDNLY